MTLLTTKKKRGGGGGRGEENLDNPMRRTARTRTKLYFYKNSITINKK